ncbi:hypothetical protein ANN_03792 [Periplaneta americana]|uniref:Uncharacterized protein n=1 Tax=Periplaneta americana TaxID=6978 RepID=A0ABQ8TZY7_PERAM|nr:hypothetical protein ANN_03792 [Periplaneta americana]
MPSECFVVPRTVDPASAWKPIISFNLSNVWFHGVGALPLRPDSRSGGKSGGLRPRPDTQLARLAEPVPNIPDMLTGGETNNQHNTEIEQAIALSNKDETDDFLRKKRRNQAGIKSNGAVFHVSDINCVTRPPIGVHKVGPLRNYPIPVSPPVVPPAKPKPPERTTSELSILDNRKLATSSVTPEPVSEKSGKSPAETPIWRTKASLTPPVTPDSNLSSPEESVVSSAQSVSKQVASAPVASDFKQVTTPATEERRIRDVHPRSFSSPSPRSSQLSLHLSSISGRESRSHSPAPPIPPLPPNKTSLQNLVLPEEKENRRGSSPVQAIHSPQSCQYFLPIQKSPLKETVGRRSPLPDSIVTGKKSPLPDYLTTGKKSPLSEFIPTGKKSPLPDFLSTGKKSPLPDFLSTGKKSPLPDFLSTVKKSPLPDHITTGRKSPLPEFITKNFLRKSSSRSSIPEVHEQAPSPSKHQPKKECHCSEFKKQPQTPGRPKSVAFAIDSDEGRIPPPPPPPRSVPKPTPPPGISKATSCPGIIYSPRKDILIVKQPLAIIKPSPSPVQSIGIKSTPSGQIVITGGGSIEAEVVNVVTAGGEVLSVVCEKQGGGSEICGGCVKSNSNFCVIEVSASGRRSSVSSVGGSSLASLVVGSCCGGSEFEGLIIGDDIVVMGASGGAGAGAKGASGGSEAESCGGGACRKILSGRHHHQQQAPTAGQASKPQPQQQQFQQPKGGGGPGPGPGGGGGTQSTDFTCINLQRKTYKYANNACKLDTHVFNFFIVVFLVIILAEF